MLKKAKGLQLPEKQHQSHALLNYFRTSRNLTTENAGVALQRASKPARKPIPPARDRTALRAAARRNEARHTAQVSAGVPVATSLATPARPAAIPALVAASVAYHDGAALGTERGVRDGHKLKLLLRVGLGGAEEALSNAAPWDYY
jgi:hypothetical protein